ncbi:MAG: flagellar hook-associated protein FlgK [Paracoccaceae bacterium]
MSIGLALQNALTGLTATSRLAEVTSGNLANALTPGYGRQSVVLTSAVAGTQGTGVRVTDVERALDPELSQARRDADGALADGAARSEALADLERLIGTDASSGLIGRIAEFEASLRLLAETPELGPRQQATAEAARDLADAFGDVDAQIRQTRSQADAEIARRVETLNDDLVAIARVNRQIQTATAAGRETAPLIDRREGLVDRVAQTLPVRQSSRPDGVLELRTLEGVPLSDVTARRINFVAAPVVTSALSFPATLSGLTSQGLDITPGGMGAQQVRGGALAGLFAVRDDIGPHLQEQVDSLAADLITRTQDPAVDPTLVIGAPGLFTDRQSAFALVDNVGIAGRIELNAAVDPALGGDPAKLRDGIASVTPRPDADATILRAVLDALKTPEDTTTPPATPSLFGVLSFADRTAQVAELLATDRVFGEANTAALAAERETLAQQESDILGVDSDAELQRLIVIEQAYAANAQVIQTASRMLEELQRIR